MRVLNIHERQIRVAPELAGEVLDSLATPEDKLWPCERWPSMRLDSPLGVGARGGHGPVRYSVQDYAPGRKAVFRFSPEGLTKGLEGCHWFEIIPDRESVVLRHVIDAECGFSVWLKWALVIRPLHDALLEDALDKAELHLHGHVQQPSEWSRWVRALRRLMAASDKPPPRTRREFKNND